MAVRSKASGRQTATRVWGEAGGVIRHQQRRRRPQQSLLKRRCQPLAKNKDITSPFADGSMPTSVLAQISGQEISRREICFSGPRIFFETRLDRDWLTSLTLTLLTAMSNIFIHQQTIY